MIHKQILKSFLINHLVADRRVCDRYILFLTVNVRHARHASVKPDMLLGEFHRCYIRICRLLVGRNFSRKHHLQPKAIVAFDRVGSKRHRTRAHSYGVYPHLHVVMSLDPSIWQCRSDVAIEDAIHEALTASNIFEKPNIQRGERARRRIKRQISYALKDAFWIDQTSDVASTSWDIFPRR